MPVCGNYLFFELPKKIVLNPKDGFFRKILGKCEKLPLSHAPHSFLTKQKLAIRSPECYTVRV